MNTLWESMEIESNTIFFGRAFRQHSQQIKRLVYRNQLGTFITYTVVQIDISLSLCVNITDLLLCNNLMIQTLKFVKFMQKLQRLNLNCCNFLEANELKHLYGHPCLTILELKYFTAFRDFKFISILLELAHEVSIKELDIERGAYLLPEQCEHMLRGSCLQVFDFSPRYKKSPAWRLFRESSVSVKFGKDLECVLVYWTMGLKTFRFYEMYEHAPFWAQHDSVSDSDSE